MSEYVDRLIGDQTHVNVAFVDIESYSSRPSFRQLEIINALTECLNQALAVVVEEFNSGVPSEADVDRDTIFVPTGDGAAIVFPFYPGHGIQLRFALALLETIDTFNESHACEEFDDCGYCRCHPAFNVRIGLSAGPAIIYKDIRKQYNVAGNVINMAQRVMDRMGRNQIGMTDEAASPLVDFADTDESDVYRHGPVDIKRGRVNIVQYVGSSRGLNVEPAVFPAGSTQDFAGILKAFDEGLVGLDVQGEDHFGFGAFQSASHIQLFFNTGHGALKRHRDVFVQRIATSGAKVELVISNTQRGGIWADDAYMHGLCPFSNIPAESEGSKNLLLEVVNDIEAMVRDGVSGTPGTLEVRLYDGGPTGSLVIVDNQLMRFTPYLPYSVKDPAFFLERKGQANLFRRLNDGFIAVWRRSTVALRIDFETGERVGTWSS